jgi:hypothetical protein
MSFITTHLEIAKDSVSNAQHEVKIVMSELLKRKMGDSKNLAILQDAYTMLQDIYRMLGVGVAV